MIEPQSLVNGRYRVGRRLGEGGMAIVYLGHDLLLGRDVAIKSLRPQFASDRAFRARFEREAHAAAALTHPNIIDIYDVGEEDRSPYIIMELVRGQSLKEIIAAEAPFHPDDVAELLEQIGGALDFAHARGYVHRDIKPANILVDEHGRARIADFGIAKGIMEADLTEHGAGFGTAAYVSPEQAEGLMATPASDIYSAGVMAYEMLTGMLPFQAETPLGLAMRHVNDPPLPPSHRRPGLSPHVDAVVLRALDKDPTRRWPSVGTFARALRDRRMSAARLQLPARAADVSPPRGSLVPTIVVVMLVATVLGALLWTGFNALPSTPEGQEAPATVLLPVITGSVEEHASADLDPEAPAAVEPELAAPTIVPQEAEIPAMPTIAPAAESQASQGQVIVPNLVGLTISGGTQALDPVGLRIVPTQPVFSDSVPLNAIASQDPAAGASVAPGARVRVSLSRGPSPFSPGNEP